MQRHHRLSIERHQICSHKANGCMNEEWDEWNAKWTSAFLEITKPCSIGSCGNDDSMMIWSRTDTKKQREKWNDADALFSTGAYWHDLKQTSRRTPAGDEPIVFRECCPALWSDVCISRRAQLDNHNFVMILKFGGEEEARTLLTLLLRICAVASPLYYL